MDKELPESAYGLVLSKVLIRISETDLDGETTLRGSVFHTPTIGVEELAQRLKDEGCSYRLETLVAVYRLMTNEVYKAVGEGYNVDFGLGRTEMTVNGKFMSVNDRFDASRHSIVPRLRPSARLRQLAAHLPGECCPGLFANAPRPNEVSLAREPYRRRESDAPFNELPAGRHAFVSVFGQRLRLMGDLPGVGITVRCLETGQEYHIAPEDIAVNSRARLCFMPRFDFTPGEWELVIGSQYNPSYRLYKEVREGTLVFTVR